MMSYVLLFLILLTVGVVLFINVHPTFGANPTKLQKEAYERFPHYENGKFKNMVPTNMKMSAADILSFIKDSMNKKQERSPRNQLSMNKIDWEKVKSKEDSLTWFGHSAFLLSIDNKKLLIDPMLGPTASPVSFIGSKRYSQDILHIIDEMPPIDAVLLTHDHYDHLDYSSIKKLKCKVNHFFVPLGVGAHLMRWGVSSHNITELNWWDEVELGGITLAFTPSKHFSGRGVLNRDSTLWGGWVILGENTRFYTSGDGGYDAHFKEVGDKYGPFTLALMEGGQYDARWSWVHMRPEESVQAHLDVKGETMMLIHWGAFTLAYHSWTDPIERAIQKAKEEDVNLLIPELGETVLLSGEKASGVNDWWTNESKEA